jgi:hypothetical protein
MYSRNAYVEAYLSEHSSNSNGHVSMFLGESPEVLDRLKLHTHYYWFQLVMRVAQVAGTRSVRRNLKLYIAGRKVVRSSRLMMMGTAAWRVCPGAHVDLETFETLLAFLS